MSRIKAYGIDYKIPQTYLLHKSPLFVSELSARTCYNSFDKSEHSTIKELNTVLNADGDIKEQLGRLIRKAENDINEQGSELLHQLSHVYFHESTLEHVNLNFLIKDTSRGVLQELARHRIGVAYSVQSTRYTMSDIINAFLVVDKFGIGGSNNINNFINRIMELDIFITDSNEYNAMEIIGIYNKLSHQKIVLGQEEFYKLSIAKSSIEDFKSSENAEDGLAVLERKAKKNVGDPFKHIVTDNFSVDLGFTVNLRAFKNLMDLRLSGAAYWQIQMLAAQLYSQLPESYLTLVVNDGKRNTFENINKKLESGVWA